MRKILCTLVLAATALTAQAQWLRVWKAGESTRYAISEMGNVPYDEAGTTLTFGTDNYSTVEIDSITIINPVIIKWEGDEATVDIPETAEGVTVNISGGNVVINNTCNDIEHEFILQGASDNGSFTYNGTYKTKFHLNGLDLTSTTGAAIDIRCGKRIDLILEEGTENSLADCAGGSQKAAFNCQGHLEIAGAGSLTIAGNTNHALRAKEYLLLKKNLGTINVTKAAADGIHCGEFFQMNGGTLNLSGTASDGLQVEADAASDEILNGQFILNGGSIDVTLSAADSKAVRLDADPLDATLIPEMYLNDGTVTVNLTATALGSKAIASDGNLTIGTASTSPSVDITVAAGVYVDPETEEKNRATGLKADQTLTIAGGTTTVAATATKARGVRAATLTATGGTLTVTNTGSKSEGIKLDNTFVAGQGGTVSGNFKY